MNTLKGQTVVRGGRQVEIIDVDGDAYVCHEVGATKTFKALRSQYDLLFLAPKGKMRSGQHYKGKAIRHSQLKGVI